MAVLINLLFDSCQSVPFKIFVGILEDFFLFSGWAIDADQVL